MTIVESVAETNQIINTSVLNEPTDGMYLRWRNEVFETLIDAELDTLADRWQGCSCSSGCKTLPTNAPVLPTGATSVVVCAEHTDHPQKVIFPTCHLRFCPDCARRDSCRLVDKYLPTLEKCARRNSKNKQLRKIVLTTDIDLNHPEVKQKIKIYLKLAERLFNEFWGKNWRKHSGVLITAEFGGEGRKLHFHCLVYGRYIEKHELSEKWQELSGHKITYIQRIEPDAVENELREAIKYATKFWSRDKAGNLKYFPPELIPKLIEVLDGTRRIRSYGIFYRLPMIKLSPVCPACGGETKIIWADDWQIYLNTGWTGLEYRSQLDLKPGNNSIPRSPPDTRLADTSPTAQPPKQKNQLFLGDEFKPDISLRGYTQ